MSARRKVVLLLIAAATVPLALIRPVDDVHFSTQRYAVEAFEQTSSLRPGPQGVTFLARAARVAITPPVGEPMAGFGAREPMHSEGLRSPVYARALTISNGRSTVTILTADLLLITPDIRAALLERLRFEQDEIYFGATHNHSGPGGYATGWLARLVMGAYQQRVFKRLVDALAGVVRMSRRDLHPVRFASMGLGSNQPYVRNRIDEGGQVYEAIHVLGLFDATTSAAIGIVVIATPHATCWGADQNLIGADYPGRVQTNLEKKYEATVLFLAGAVGSMTVNGAGEVCERYVGDTIATRASSVVDFLMRYGPAAPILSSDLVRFTKPATHLRFHNGWRITPALTDPLFTRFSYVHVLRLGDTILIGMPADYSGELMLALDERLRSQPGGKGLHSIVTSFNGDYSGYALPRDRYDLDHYESRTMNFHGPWYGEFLNELSYRAVVKHSQHCATEDCK